MIFDALTQRLRANLGRPVLAGAALASVRHLAGTLTEDGSWTDVDYRPGKGLHWPAIIHLERVLAFSRARAACPGELDGAFVRALDFWLGHDSPAPDAWYHQIGVPRLVGAAAFLSEDALSSGARGKVSEILARSRWSRRQGGKWSDWQATHLAAVAFNILLRGCLEAIPSWCQEAFERVYAGICVASPGIGGIQADMSFFQADATTPADRHGLTFAEHCARFLVLGHSTAWQAPVPCLGLFASFLLDGQQWTIRRRFFDGGMSDTSFARPSDGLDGLAVVVEELSELGVTPRRAEMAAFARRLRSADEPALSGHRHFWRGGLAVHQRPVFYASVRAGGQSADGQTCLVCRGDEYEAAESIWDRRRLPGTTALQTADVASDQPTSQRHRVGGVTDGEYGVSMLELHRGSVTGRKAWFFFDESVVCLGSGIGGGDGSAPVFTSINQCLAQGPATACGKGGETHVLSPGKSYDLSAAYRLDHGGVVYAFPEPMAVRGRVAPQGGQDVFSLWIDHGTLPRHDAYAYAMLPGADPVGHRVTEQEFSQLKILANTPARQAVWHQGIRLVGIVFWEPGVIELPSGGRVAVNRPCVLLGQDRRPEGVRLSIASPTPEATTIHVEYANRCLCFNLPAGPRGGQGMTRVL